MADVDVDVGTFYYDDFVADACNSSSCLRRSRSYKAGTKVGNTFSRRYSLSFDAFYEIAFMASVSYVPHQMAYSISRTITWYDG